MIATLFSDDEPNVTREVVMSCVGHSLGYVDWRILSQQFERYDAEGRQLVYCSLGRISYFKYDFHEVELLVDKLEKIESGFQIFYNCLRDTQDRCRGHLILADDLGLEARSMIVICVAHEVLTPTTLWLGRHGNKSFCLLFQADTGILP